MPSNVMRNATSSTLAFLWFIALFVVTLCVATVTLSASQFQNRLQALSTADGPITIWQVARLERAWHFQEQRIAEALNAVDVQQKLVTDLQARLDNLETEMGAIRGAYARAASDLSYKLALYDPLGVGDEGVGPKDAKFELGRQRVTFDKVVEGLKGNVLPNTWSAISNLHAQYLAALELHVKTEDELTRIRSTSAAAQLDLERIKARMRAAEAELSRILDPDGALEGPAEARIYDVISEFTFIKDFALGTLYEFSVLPTDFLIIILVVAMGVLGSTMQLTYDYYRGENIGSPSLFILRPMLGAISALVVFILLRAGVLVVTDSSTLTDSVPLNPFFIAFVGIVSGLLSENAMETVRRVGSTWFTAAPDSNTRWAAGVAELLSDEKTIEDLAARTGIDQGDLKAWAEQEKATPESVQRVFAAWLNRDVRSLFTDMPPAGTISG